MEFLKDLQEARLTRDNGNLRILTYNDCCEKFYLHLLALEFMRQFPISTVFVRNYAKKTFHDNYKHFKIAGTDTYNLLYFLNGDDTALGKLKDPGAAKQIQSITALPLTEITTYLQKISNGVRPTSPQQLFIRLENGLRVTNKNYKEIRRSLSNFDTLPTKNKKIYVTKLLFALRAKLRNSDIIESFTKLVAQFDLESSLVKDDEPTFSKPDLMNDTRKISNYKYLTQSENILLIKQFLDHIESGKSIPSGAANAFAPVIQIIDDIVTAGPTYISMLKSIQKRAKKSR